MPNNPTADTTVTRYLGDSSSIDLLSKVLQTVLGCFDRFATADKPSITNMQAGVQLLPVAGLQNICKALMFGVQLRVAWWYADVEAREGSCVAAAVGRHDCYCCCCCSTTLVVD